MRSSPCRPVLLTVLLLAACGAREAVTVAETSPLDDRLSCAHLSGELGANEARAVELGGESERRTRDNVGLVLMNPVAAVVFLDDGRTQRSETAALARRNERLRALLRVRGCPAAG